MTPDFSTMGRGDLIEHAKRLRAVLERARVHEWATSQNFADIESWEKDVRDALKSAGE